MLENFVCGENKWDNITYYDYSFFFCIAFYFAASLRKIIRTRFFSLISISKGGNPYIAMVVNAHLRFDMEKNYIK